MIPLGGYVKITGMTPDELASVDLRVAERSYYMKEPWKRIVVILAGPAVNLLLAFVLFAAVLLSRGLDGADAIGNLAPSQTTINEVAHDDVGAVVAHTGAAGVLRAGDRSWRSTASRSPRPTCDHALASAALRRHATNGCAATRRCGHGRARRAHATFTVTPHYDAQ